MNEQGSSDVFYGAFKLDRIAGLEKVIFRLDITEALDASSKVDSRKCTLTHEVMMWVVLAMGLFTDMPIRSQHFRIVMPMYRASRSR